MAPASEPDRSACPRLVLRRLDQATAAVVLAVALSLLAGHWLLQGRLRGRLVEIDRAQPVAVKLQIDVNTADWSDLASGNFPETGRPPELVHSA